MTEKVIAAAEIAETVERVFSKDPRVLINRFIKDQRFYIPFIILTGLFLFITTGGLDGTQYAAYASLAIAVIRVIMKGLEKYKPEDFVWYWDVILKTKKEVESVVENVKTIVGDK